MQIATQSVLPTKVAFSLCEQTFTSISKDSSPHAFERCLLEEALLEARSLSVMVDGPAVSLVQSALKPAY